MSATTDLRLSTKEGATLAALLDHVIPPSGDGVLPGAGEIGLVPTLEDLARRIPGIAPVLAQGLAAADAIASTRHPGGLAALAPDERREVVEALGATEPAFLPTLTFLAYVGYYQQRSVVESLGLEHRPPHPRGHEMEANDLTLLEPVRRRSKLYREV